jgi:hypothetical protein
MSLREGAASVTQPFAACRAAHARVQVASAGMERKVRRSLSLLPAVTWLGMTRSKR